MEAEHRFKDEWLVRVALTLPGLTPEKLAELRLKRKPYLAHALLEASLTDPGALKAAIEATHRVTCLDAMPEDIDKMALGLIPERVCRAKDILPMRVEGDCIDVLMANPLDLDTISDIQAFAGRQPRPRYILPESLHTLIETVFSRDAVVYDLLKKVEENESVEVIREKEAAVEGDNDPGDAHTPIIRLVNSIIVKAVRLNASDIHIEHEENSSHVRLRMDGGLKSLLSLPAYIGSGPVVSRIKIMSDLDVAEHRKPQDGRAKLRVGSGEVGLRVSILPTSFGEKVVIRILDKRAAEVPIEKLGMRPEVSAKFLETIAAPQGILLVTGPTGSGKTTTLYSVLNRLKSADTNIVTVEDPIEYRVEGINQVQVNEKAGLTFAAILRSVLRQDPDIILVGEIRDRETADTALQAALTGHFVLSTLHTNDAIGAITRLGDMGTERFKIASGLVGVLAQRLVRRLCPDCKQKADLSKVDPGVVTALRNLGGEPICFEPKGCVKCGSTGYKGRLPIIEFLSVGPVLKEKIAAGKGEAELRQAASESGALQTMTRDALWHLRNGDTSSAEILPYLDPAAFGGPLPPPVPRASVEGTASAASPQAGSKKRVLVTDDDQVIRLILKQILTKGGYEVLEASDGVKALEKLAVDVPDLLLCDLNMPNLDGYGVIRGVRESLGLGDLPIIVLTADSEDASQEEALRLGADDYLLKPVKPAIVLARIRALFRRRGAAAIPA
jgi:type IV pilus assembly protein PilB